MRTMDFLKTRFTGNGRGGMFVQGAKVSCQFQLFVNVDSLVAEDYQ